MLKALNYVDTHNDSQESLLRQTKKKEQTYLVAEPAAPASVRKQCE